VSSSLGGGAPGSRAAATGLLAYPVRVGSEGAAPALKEFKFALQQEVPLRYTDSSALKEACKARGITKW
jgi:hypothetical protein